MQHIQIRSFKNGGTTYSAKIVGEREISLCADVGDSPTHAELVNQSRTHQDETLSADWLFVLKIESA